MLLGTVLLLFQAAFSFSAAAATTPIEPSETVAPTFPTATSGKVIMLVIDAWPVDVFVAPEWMNLRRVAERGVIGLMNVRTTAPLSFAAAAAHATIGAGARAPAGTLSGYSFDTNAHHNGVPVTELYKSTTGLDAADSAIVVLGFPQLQAAAAGQPEGARPGALGQAVAARGGRSALIGNADAPAVDGSLLFRRYGALIAMDERGQIPLGAVGSPLLTYDADWPYGLRTDYDAIWNMFTAVYADADFVVVELGDFARLDALLDSVAPERMLALQDVVAVHIDAFLDRLMRWEPAAGAHLAIVSPAPPSAGLRHNFLLTPFVWTTVPDSSATPATVASEDGGASSGSAAPGPALATSRATRRSGIIANTDIAPTVLLALDSPRNAGNSPNTVASVGHAIQGAAAGQLTRDLPPTITAPTDSWEAVALLYERATLTHNLRAPVVRTFISAAITVFVAWVAWMIYIHIAPAAAVPLHALTVWRWLMLLLNAAPMAMLLLPLFPGLTTSASAITLSLLTGMLATASHLLGRSVTVGRINRVGGPPHVTDAFVYISLATAAALIVDVAMGARLMKSSVLGYDPIVGARFYGIGNEYMGVLIGTTLVGTTGLLDRLGTGRRGAIVVTAVYAIVCSALAAPVLGANVGGTIAAVVGFGITATLLFSRRLTWKAWLLVGAAVIAVLTAAAAFDLLFRQGQLSHLGQTVQIVYKNGLQPLRDIVARKLSMNAKLLRWTIWAQVFVVSLAVSALALYRPAKSVRRLEQRHPMLLHGIRGAIVAAIVALIANDSGVVAAATMMIPVTATLMYLFVLQRAAEPT